MIEPGTKARRKTARVDDRIAAAAIFLALTVFTGMTPAARAHPVSQGAAEITIYSDHVEVRARVSTEEVFVRQAFAASSGAPARDLAEAWRDHGLYLTQHIRVLADGRPMTGRPVGVIPPAEGKGAAGSRDRLVCELEYRLPPGGEAPAEIRVEEDVLNEIDYAPGNRWEASYVASIGQTGAAPSEGRLLTSRDPLLFHCEWNAAAAASAATQPPGSHAGLDRWRLALEYTHHGIMHILTGYDHLLFISALALATVSLWDLIKVVGVFTLAHTCTLTLATFNIVRLSEHVVEPMISASIVFVALQNVFWPGRSRGTGRLLVAFFFGLFHGLGFAGGLLEAMENLPGVAIVVALAAFSVGVELGHQVVVLPLFFGLKWLRCSRANPLDRARVSAWALRFGSAVISVAGMYYLVIALRG